jgi:hypothetical protein
MEGLGSGVRLPSAPRSNCMKTRFQISSQRSQSQATPRQGRPAFSSAQGMSFPWKKWISEQGPHGPVSPMAQKLSLAPSLWMRLSGMPCPFHRAKASSSQGSVPSPAKTVAAQRSLSSPSHFGLVTNSQAQATASFLK